MRLADLLPPRRVRRGARVALDELTREAVTLGAYDSTADDYRDSLDRERQQSPRGPRLARFARSGTPRDHVPYDAETVVMHTGAVHR